MNRVPRCWVNSYLYPYLKTNAMRAATMINDTAAAKPTHSGICFSPPLLLVLLRSMPFYLVLSSIELWV